ncbi:OadG family protein [Rhodobium gokarnense]|uniref:Na+-transporting methylmalonyl-CoA/oxaloacetate decarboxylase gamma subunit n=1 Tax=Rhodobium gokarnense TaxID=364296 RepID=A0ABT3HA23_9HYPH|nr:OadG family protein [Rhodobium gokarnense]MCW2307141.1 Na+-transporting methylmalonyl-CoA/oxaloacetate decarboxylase gamma subunit [Rhodobium gokarnense]
MGAMLENLEMIGTGFSVVMLVLALIWAACALIGLFFTRGTKVEAKDAEKPAPSQPALAAATPGVPPHHLVAISAAVAATLGGGYRVTRIAAPAHKVGDWPLEGRIQTFNGHRTRADWAAMRPPLGGAAQNDKRGNRP